MARASRMIAEADVTCTIKASRSCRWDDDEIAEVLVLDVTTVRRTGRQGQASAEAPLAEATGLEPPPEGWGSCVRCHKRFEGEGRMCSQRCRAKAAIEAKQRHEARRGKRRR